MQTNEREIIIEHALEDDKNLEIALDIISMTQEIRERITNNVFEKLQVFLKKKKELTESQFEWDFEALGGVTSKSEDLPKVGIHIAGTEKDKFIGIFSKSFHSTRQNLNRFKRCGITE